MCPPALSPTDPAAVFNLSDSPLIERYREKTPTSDMLAARSRGVFPSGITHDVRYTEPYGIFVTKAQGSHKWDVDGNQYVDYPAAMVPCCWAMAIRQSSRRWRGSCRWVPIMAPAMNWSFAGVN